MTRWNKFFVYDTWLPGRRMHWYDCRGYKITCEHCINTKRPRAKYQHRVLTPVNIWIPTPTTPTSIAHPSYNPYLTHSSLVKNENPRPHSSLPLSNITSEAQLTTDTHIPHTYHTQIGPRLKCLASTHQLYVMCSQLSSSFYIPSMPKTKHTLRDPPLKAGVWGGLNNRWWMDITDRRTDSFAILRYSPTWKSWYS